MFLSFAVRKEGMVPPLENFAGLPFLTTILSLTIFGHVVLMRQHGLAGWLVHVVVVVIFGLVGDGLVSNSLGRNVQRLRENGFSDGVTFLIALFNSFASQFIGYLVVYVICTRPDFTDEFWRCLTINLWGKILLNMAGGDLLFWACHRALHRNDFLAPLHVMHHCCRNSSWSTNVLFHPIDLGIEFAGPAALLLIAYLFNGDQLALYISYLAVQVYYAADHDEFLALPHTRHHSIIDSRYAIYSYAKSKPGVDFVRSRLEKPKKVAS